MRVADDNQKLAESMTVPCPGIRKGGGGGAPGHAPAMHSSFETQFIKFIKGECSVFIFFIMDENDALFEYNKIPVGQNRTNGAVYSKIYFKVEICSAH